MQRQNVLRAFSYIVPLLVGLILVFGSSFKLFQPPVTDNSRIEYIEAFSELTYPQAYAHDIDIRLPGVKVLSITSPLAIEYTCDKDQAFNADRICLRLYEQNLANEGPLFTAQLSIPMDKGAVIASSDSFATYYSDTSFNQSKPQQLRLLNKFNELSLSMGNSTPSILGLTDNVEISEMNIPLLLSLIVGVGFVLASLAIIVYGPRSKSSGVGFKKYAGQIFSFLFLFLSTIGISIYISNTTQAPTQIDAAILWKEPIEYFEVQLEYLPEQDSVTFTKLIPRSGYMPKAQEIDDPKLTMDLKAKDGSSLYSTNVILPQLRIPPLLEGEQMSAVDQSKVGARQIIAFIPQFQGQSLLDITFKGQVLISYDVSEYILPEISRSNTLRSMAFAPGPAAPNDGYFDLVLIGDDYSAEQMAQFRSDANLIEDTLYSIQPYKIRSSQVRVSLIENTQDLGCYRLPAVPRCVICDNSLVMQKVIQAAIPYDKVGVIYNDGEYGGCGDYFGTVFQVANGPIHDMVAIHELGHNLGADDEYTYGGTGSLSNPQTCSLTNPNPLWEGIVSRDEYYSECTYDNYYRSSQESIMRTLNVRYFNAVTNRLFHQQLNQLAGDYVGNSPLIDTTITSPQSGDYLTQNINITVEYSDETNIQRAELWINGELKTTKYLDFNQFYITSIPDSETTIIVKAYDGAERTGLEGRLVLNSEPSITNTPVPTTVIPTTIVPTTPFTTLTPTLTPSTFNPTTITPSPSVSVTQTVIPTTIIPSQGTSITPTPTSSNVLKPDLRPEGLERSTLNPTYVFKIRICNRGSADRTIGAMLFEVRNLGNGMSRVYSSVLPQANNCLDLENVFCNDLGVECSDPVELQIKVDPYNYVSEKDENNNTQRFVLNSQNGDTPTPQASITLTPTVTGSVPDLLPEELNYDNENKQVSARICNNGGNYNGLLQYYLYNVPDDLVHEASESVSISASKCLDLQPLSCNLVSKNCQGEIFLEMVLDPQNEILEDQELNNRRLLSFSPPMISPTKAPTMTPKSTISPSPTNRPSTTTTNNSGGLLIVLGGIMIGGSSFLLIAKYRKELLALISPKAPQI